jgi:hypothetical protein
VARTLVDLAAVLSIDDLARVCHEAGVRHEFRRYNHRDVAEHPEQMLAELRTLLIHSR